MTPYEAYTGKRPNLTKLRLFGCPLVARKPGRRPAKVDIHAARGIFLGYTATDNNVYYKDDLTKRIKVATHVTFDEAGYTIPENSRSSVQMDLQRSYCQRTNTDIDIFSDNTDLLPLVENSESAPTTDVLQNPPPVPNTDLLQNSPTLQVKLLSNNATLPTRASMYAAGYDLYSAVDMTIPPTGLYKIPTDISITPPPNTYAKIESRSGLLLHNRIEVKGGIIDRDYTGNIIVLLKNDSAVNFQVKKGIE
jgi:dUTP pyrophosphatase